MNPSKARENEVERTPTTKDIFYSGHLQPWASEGFFPGGH